MRREGETQRHLQTYFATLKMYPLQVGSKGGGLNLGSVCKVTCALNQVYHCLTSRIVKSLHVSLDILKSIFILSFSCIEWIR